MRSRTLVIASGNAGKIREFAGLLAHLPLSLEPQPAGTRLLAQRDSGGNDDLGEGRIGYA